MDWNEVIIKVAVEDSEAGAAIAQMTVPGGLYIEDYSDMEPMVWEIAHIDLVDEALLAKDRSHALIHLYLPEEGGFLRREETVSFLRQMLEQADIRFSLETGTVREENWATAWKAHYHPFAIGKRIVICPSWESYDPAPGALVIRLDPGMAFGTGTHQTTMLCVRALETLVNTGDTVLDLGTGSGILSIAALMLGAGAALGVDIDPVAVRVAGENAAANGMGDAFTSMSGDLLELEEKIQKAGPFDLITANIVADVIIGAAPMLSGWLKKGGRVVASGIIDARGREVADALTGSGLIIGETAEEGGWLAITAQKP